MGKTFNRSAAQDARTATPPQEPRSAANDPSFGATFVMLTEVIGEPAVEPTPSPTPAPRKPAVASFEKRHSTTFHPAQSQRDRLSAIKYHHKVGESFVVEYALERLFDNMSDEEIANELKARGFGLTRPKRLEQEAS